MGMTVIQVYTSFMSSNIRILLLILLLVGSAFFNFHQYNTIQNLQSKNLQLFKERDGLQAQLKELQKNYQLVFEDRAEFIEPNSPEETFSFQTFGINSPLFETKKVESQEYLYRGKTIIRKTIYLDSKSDSVYSYGVSVWQFPDTKKDFDPLYLSIFDGYENRGNPHRISDVIAEAAGKYVTKNNIQLHWSVDTSDLYSTKLINFNGISLYATDNSVILDGPIFYRVFASLHVEEENLHSVSKIATKELMRIADTITFR